MPFMGQRGGGDDKRNELRAVHRLAVELEIEGQSVSTLARNVSLGGIFLETEAPLREGAQVRLRFTVPAQREPIVTIAEVRWLEKDGVGLRFVGLRARDVWA